MEAGKKNKTLKAVFYQTEGGAEPVRAELLKLGKEDRRIIGTDVKDVEFAWPIGMPLCRPVGNLWEVRSNLSNGRIYRILFIVDNQIMVLLHSFLKKTAATPKKEKETALNRLKDFNKRKK